MADKTLPTVKVSGMPSFSVGNRVAFKPPMPKSVDWIGVVELVDDEYVWVKWEGLDAPREASRHLRFAVEPADDSALARAERRLIAARERWEADKAAKTRQGRESPDGRGLAQP